MTLKELTEYSISFRSGQTADYFSSGSWS